MKGKPTKKKNQHFFSLLFSFLLYIPHIPPFLPFLNIMTRILLATLGLTLLSTVLGQNSNTNCPGGPTNRNDFSPVILGQRVYIVGGSLVHTVYK